MAFNPQFNTQDPRYWNWFKPSAEPMADKSTGIALETLGKGIEGAAGLADTTVKNTIEDTLSENINQKKQNFINELDSYQTANNTPRTSTNPMDANAMDLEAGAGNKPPQEVDRGIQRIAQLQNAKDQAGGKVRTTPLDASILDTQKDLRSKFPGYRDYIDQKSKQITGYDPANKLISDKISEINEQRSQRQKENEYWEKTITTSGYSGSEAALDNFRKTGDIAAAEHWIARNAEADARVTRSLRAYQLSNAQSADHAAKAEGALVDGVTRAVTDSFMNKNETDPQSAFEMSKKLFDMSKHPGALVDEATRSLGIQLEATRQRTRQQIGMLGMSFADKDGKNLYSAVGPERYNKLVDGIVEGIFGAQKQMLVDKDLGLLGASNRILGDVGSDSALRMVHSGSDLSAYLRTIQGIQKLGPQSLTPELQSYMWGNFNKPAESLVKMNAVQYMQGIAQTGGATVAPDGSQTYTFKQSQDEVRSAAAATHASPASEAKSYKDLIGFSRAILEPHPTVADNAITYFYSPNNIGSLNKFMDDYYDPSNGQVKKGRTSAFDTLTSQPITKAIYKRSQEGNTSAWPMYKDWTTKEAGQHLNEIVQGWNDSITPLSKNWLNSNSLWNNLTGNKSGEQYKSGSDFHYYYDNEEHHIGMMLKNGEVIRDNMMDPIYAQQLKNANRYLDGLIRVSHEEGSNPDVLIFNTLLKAAPPQSTPELQKILKAIGTSFTPPEPKKEEK